MLAYHVFHLTQAYIEQLLSHRSESYLSILTGPFHSGQHQTTHVSKTSTESKFN